ncbi:peptidase, partial [Bifidobacteriaceae bacterium WP012]
AEINKDFKTNTYVLKVTLKTKVTKGTKNFTNFITGWIDNSKIGDGDQDHPCVPTKDNPCDKNPHGTSHFATLKITKVNDAKEGKGKKVLKGAKFAVYSIKNDSTNLDGVTTQNLATTTDPVKTGTNDDQLTIETGDDGTASVDLFISNDDKTTSKKYCLVETEAPAGFKKDETPHCYAVETETSTNVSATKPVADANSKEIVNAQATELDKILGNLPMTGARGLVILTVCGIVGIAGTLFYIVMKRRKEQEQE